MTLRWFFAFPANPDILWQPAKQWRNSTIFRKYSYLKLLDVKNCSFTFPEPDFEKIHVYYLNLIDLKGSKFFSTDIACMCIFIKRCCSLFYDFNTITILSNVFYSCHEIVSM